MMFGRILRCTPVNSLAAVLALLVGGVLASAAEPASPVKHDSSNRSNLSKVIDQHILQRLQAEKVAPSPLADDAEFVRRVHLDLIGKIPTRERTVAFLNDADPQKRAKLIEELLASSDFGKHQADIWQVLLLPRNSDNRAVQRDPMIKWLEESFNSNKPWDKCVQEILTATGTQDKNGAVTYYLSNGTVDKLTDSTARLFLGVQLQCAQCHNHPFTDWKQTDYWHMAAFFMRVQVDQVRPAAAANNTATPGVVEVDRPRRGRNALPVSAKILPPKYLQGAEAKIESAKPLRPVLADWMTSPSNPYFSKAMVNRTWAQMFGRGLVNAVDDMHDGNPATHPELLTELAKQFSANGFDLKDLFRSICNSQAYQRTSKPSGNNAEANAALYSRMAMRVLSPEQLYDSLAQVLGNPLAGAGPRRQGMAGRGAPATPRGAFIAFFNIEDADPTEYQVGIPQVLRLMNSAQMNNDSALAKILKDPRGQPAEVIQELYLGVLSRKPTPTETEILLAHVKKQTEPKKGYADVLWALLNSSEFTLNH
jgi:Protein of unknown function (DUF1549)/Protein of unknown function (DUF1553)